MRIQTEYVLNMPSGCMNPTAANYDPSATTDPGNVCIYVKKNIDGCNVFRDDMAGITSKDTSFTLSWSLESDNWVFFHDYTPDFYFHVRKKLLNLKGSQIWRNNLGAPGKYYDQSTPKSFFIDVVFSSEQEMTINTVNWLSEVLSGSTESEFHTLTHISIWNDEQHSSRIAIQDVFEFLQEPQARKLTGTWSFNDFRDLVITRGSTIIQDIFHNFDPVAGTLDTGELGWYEKKLMEGLWFIVRFEFDNTTGETLYLNDTTLDITKSVR